MSQPLLLPEAAWLCGVLGPQESDFLPLDCTVNTSALDFASFLGSVLTQPGSRATPPLGLKLPQPWAYPPAVITELEDVIGIRECLGAHDGLEERLCQLLPIHVESALEEPVSAVLAVGDDMGRGR